MDLTVPTKDLRPAIIAAADAVPRKTNVLPALTMVRIDAREDGVVTIEGTDLELTILADVRGTVATPGQLCVPAHQLAEIAKETDHETIRIRATKKGVAVEADRSRFELASMPATDYVRYIVDNHPGLADRIIQMETTARPGLRVIQGLWRRPRKGARGTEPRPGSMSEFIVNYRRTRLLPRTEVEAEPPLRQAA